MLYRLEIVADEADYDRLCGLLALHAPFGWEEESLPTGETRFRIHCEAREHLERLRLLAGGTAPQFGNAHNVESAGDVRCELTQVEEKDWQAAWRQFFTPVECGPRFTVLPPWLADAYNAPSRMPIIIEPKSAFGTGHHATTALCLAILGELLETGRIVPNQTFLDLGTGSGVLGLACARAGLTGEGLDTDPLAVANAVENRGLNRVRDEAFIVASGDVTAVAGRSFDLVLANILARPLMDMAPALRTAVKPGGCLILSGILARQADAVERAYREQGLGAARRVHDGEWCALVWA